MHCECQCRSVTDETIWKLAGNVALIEHDTVFVMYEPAIRDWQDDLETVAATSKHGQLRSDLCCLIVPVTATIYERHMRLYLLELGVM